MFLLLGVYGEMLLQFPTRQIHTSGLDKGCYICNIFMHTDRNALAEYHLQWKCKLLFSFCGCFFANELKVTMLLVVFMNRLRSL